MQGIDSSGVTLSVVSHGQRALLQCLLADLARVRPPQVRRLIITLNLHEQEPDLSPPTGWDVRVLRNERPQGFGANHNQAFRHCETGWFAILNPDLRLTVDPWTPLLSAASDDDGLLAPRVLEEDGRTADAARVLLTPWQLLRRAVGHRAAASPGEADWLAGMFLLARSKAFAAVGGFDERFFMYCEDADLSIRLQLAGWRVRQIPDASVVHAAQRASRGSTRHVLWHVSSLSRHWASAAFWRYLARRGTLRRAGARR